MKQATVDRLLLTLRIASALGGVAVCFVALADFNVAKKLVNLGGSSVGNTRCYSQYWWALS
jgi:hypothetical protein